MKTFFSFLSPLLIIIIVVFSSCSKDEDPILPTISFKQEVGYVSANSAASFGDTLHFGIVVKSNGTDNIVKLQVLLNSVNVVDSTINSATFATDITAYKDASDKDVWVFIATDIAGNVKRDSIIVTGNFGEILTYSDIKFGAQNNTAEKSFLSFSNSAATLYFQAEAFNHQSEIDMFCFYEETATAINKMALAAPGSNISGIFTGSTAPSSYTMKNVTFFVKTTLTAADFDAVKNDGVIQAAYNPNNKFKKAKLLTAGDVYAFKLQSGKLGLYKVIAVNGKEDGTLQIAVKIQK